MLRKLPLGIAAVAVVFAAVVATRPSTFHVERSVTIAAPAEHAYAQVNDLHAWSAWSPYEKLDASMTRTFSGPATGPGASYAWAGDRRAGKGRMTIENSVSPSLVGIRLEMIEPFGCTNAVTFTFAPTAEGTRVTWAMTGPNSTFGKIASLFVDMDSFVGGDFERGLADLKRVAEMAAKTNVAAANAK
jgi:hypothetical protein